MSLTLIASMASNRITSALSKRSKSTDGTTDGSNVYSMFRRARYVRTCSRVGETVRTRRPS